MKKTFLLVPGGIMVMSLVMNYGFAQNSVHSAACDSNRIFKQAIPNIAKLESHGSGEIFAPNRERINPKAIDDFQIRYTDVNNVLWISNAAGFVCYYTKGGLMNRVYYDKKGQWVFSVLMYKEDKLPRNIRSSVKSQYFDMAISFVEELQFEDHKAYVVYLEDNSNIKILKVNEEGECEAYQDITK